MIVCVELVEPAFVVDADKLFSLFDFSTVTANVSLVTVVLELVSAMKADRLLKRFPLFTMVCDLSIEGRLYGLEGRFSADCFCS